MTDRPDHAANSYPWTRQGSAARLQIEAFLAVARKRLEGEPCHPLPFPRDMGMRVLTWLWAGVDCKPGSD